MKLNHYLAAIGLSMLLALPGVAQTTSPSKSPSSSTSTAPSATGKPTGKSEQDQLVDINSAR
jgi:hypothetical protein